MWGERGERKGKGGVLPPTAVVLVSASSAPLLLPPTAGALLTRRQAAEPPELSREAPLPPTLQTWHRAAALAHACVCERVKRMSQLPHKCADARVAMCVACTCVNACAHARS